MGVVQTFISGLVVVVLKWTVPAPGLELSEINSSLMDLSFQPYEHHHGYVNIRPHANTFYWLFKTSHPDGFRDRPLIMWLQGGPGASSVGYGNFGLIGPLQLDLTAKPYSWVKEASILFVDNPVGAGFSYVTESRAYTTDVTQIAMDLLTFFKEFMDLHPDFRNVPFYIFGQSYGGKMGAAFAQRLHTAINAEEIDCNFRGVAMGNAWISPLDSVVNWGPILYDLGIVSDGAFEDITEMTNQVEEAIANDQWDLSSRMWAELENVIWDHSDQVDFYNFMKYVVDDDKKKRRKRSLRYSRSADLASTIDLSSPFKGLFPPSGARGRYHHPDSTSTDQTTYSLTDLMDGPVHDMLGIATNVTYDDQYGTVFDRQSVDFMKPVLDIVSDLLEKDIEVIVYEGQVDLICCVKGALDWIQKLTWSGLSRYNRGRRLTLTNDVTKQPELFIQAYDNFKFYTILNAGHSVAADAPEASYRMMKRILERKDP